MVFQPIACNPRLCLIVKQKEQDVTQFIDMKHEIQVQHKNKKKERPFRSAPDLQSIAKNIISLKRHDLLYHY